MDRKPNAHRAHSLQRIAGPIALAVIVGCSNASPAVTSSPSESPAVTLDAAPATFAFPAAGATPQSVTVTRSSGSFASLVLSVGDPTLYGTTAPVLSGTNATFTILPIAASSSTTVTATDGTGASTSINVGTTACSRLPTLVAAQQAFPADGAAGVSTSIGTMYFVAYYKIGAATGGHLHLTAGTHGTIEGGSLVTATLPPGTGLPTPIPLPGVIDVVVSASVPTLAAGQTYRTQLYNDPCEPPIVAGTFST